MSMKISLRMLRFHVSTATQSHTSSFVPRARPLSCPGCNLKGVKLLQSHDDAQDIHGSCQGRNVAVIGASFIGYQILLTWLNESLMAYLHKTS